METKIEKKSEERSEDRIVRILSKDVEGKMTVYSGLAKIKGISWSVSNAVCKILKLDKKRKIGSLTNDEIEKISNLVKGSKLPTFLVNRRKDFDTGKDEQLVGSDLDLKKEFDIKRLKKIKVYRGYRHIAGLTMRGQRTKANFRKNRKKGSGIKKKVAKVGKK